VRVVVTGASGFCGRAACRALVAAGHHVTVVVRGRDAAQGIAADRVAALGELTPATDWVEALAGADAVVHLAARTAAPRNPTPGDELSFRQVNVEATRALARAMLRAGVRRLVFASSTKVNGEATLAGAPFTARSAVAPADLYARTKAEAEGVLLGLAPGGLEPVLLRPPVMYGPGMKGNLALLFKLAERGVPLPIASIRNARDLLAVDAFADLVVRAVSHPDAAGRIFVARDGEAVSTPELYTRIGHALAKPVRTWPMPTGMLRLAGRMTGLAGEVERLVGNLEIDDGATRELLGWKPARGMDEVLAETAAWWRARNGAGAGPR
jgi:nucleoside-diphosphate-sugar epimerase